MCVNGGQGAMLATMAGTCMGVPIQKRIGGGKYNGVFWGPHSSCIDSGGW